MIKYLENNICEFECLFELNPNIKKNIISISFFKMYGGGYKDFNLYINGFLKIHKSVLKENKYNFWIRLFIDRSIYNDKELFKIIGNLERVEIVLYSCEKYLEDSDSNYHIGIFGTFIRYFPMFDFPNNDGDIVMISDMDDYYIFNENIDLMNKLEKKYIEKIYFLTSGLLAKNVVHNHDYLNKNHINPYVVSSKFISFKRVDYKLLTDYFKNFGSKNIDELINSYGLITDINNEKIKKYKKFVYGMDENFLNYYLTPFLIDNNIPYVVNIIWSIDDILYYYTKFNKKLNDKEIELLNYMIKYLFERINIKYNPKKTFKDNMNILNNLLYNDRGNKNKLIYYFYKMILYLSKNKNYSFLLHSDLFKIIKEYNLFGVYELDCFIYYNINPEPIIIYKKIKKFNNDDIKKLKLFAQKYTNIF